MSGGGGTRVVVEEVGVEMEGRLRVEEGWEEDEGGGMVRIEGRGGEGRGQRMGDGGSFEW